MVAPPPTPFVLHGRADGELRVVVGIALLLSGVGFMILALGGALENRLAFADRRIGETFLRYPWRNYPTPP